MPLNTVSDDELRTYVGHFMGVIDPSAAPPPTGSTGGGGGGLDQATADTRYVNVTGDTMTGGLLFSPDNTHNIGAPGWENRPANIYTFNIESDLGDFGDLNVSNIATLGEIVGAAANLNIRTGGASGSIRFQSSDFTTRWRFGLNATDSYSLLPNATNVYDIGSATATVRSLYVGTSIALAGKPIAISPDAGNTLVWNANGLFTPTGFTQAQADARYPLKTDLDPYPTYLTQAEGDARYQTPAQAAALYLPLTGGTLSGNLLFSADNTKDIGASGATRPRDLFLGRNLVVGGIASGNGTVPAGGSSGQVLTKSSATDYAVGWTTPAGSGVASTTTQEEFKPAAAATFVDLAITPTEILLASRDGVVQSETDGHFSVSGKRVTFTDAFDGNERVTIAYATGVAAPVEGGLTPTTADALYVNVVGDTMTGNLGFSGTGRLITGDLSAATAADRLAIQSSVLNGASYLNLLPNGSSTVAGFNAYGASNPASAPYVSLLHNGTEALIYNTTGAVAISAAGTERLRIAADGTVTASGDLRARDVYASRGDGTGVYYFAGLADRYLYYSGNSRFILAGGNLQIPSGILELTGASCTIHSGANPLVFDMAGIGEVGRFAGFDFQAVGALMTKNGYLFFSSGGGSNCYLRYDAGATVLSIVQMGRMDIWSNLRISPPGYGIEFGDSNHMLQTSGNNMYFDEYNGNYYWRASSQGYALSMGLDWNYGLHVHRAIVGSGVMISTDGHYYGANYYSSTGTFVTWPSEGHLKTNIQTKSVLPALANPKLRGIEYNAADPEWITETPGKPDKLRWKAAKPQKQRGFIAEDWASEFPDLVVDGPGGVRGFNQMGMVPVVWEAVREVYAEVLALRARVAALEAA